MASQPDSSLEAGLTALKQGDYPTAIAILEAVCQTPCQQTAQLQAQMGLITAYARTGATSRAIALYQTLTHSDRPQVKAWAVRQHAELIKSEELGTRSQDSKELLSPASDLTGFVPVEIQESKASSQESKVKEQEEKQISEQKDKGDFPVTSPPAPPALEWRQAGRAKQRRSHSQINLIPLWLLQCGTAISLFWLLREIVKLTMALTNNLLVKLPYLEPFQPFYRDPTQPILLLLGLLIILAPWLIDILLRLAYGLRALELATLATYSPEASRVLQRYCQQRQWQVPTLGVLPTSAPAILTYGNLPRTARIIVSQGLLEQLADDEIAAIYAAQLGQIGHRDVVVMSLFLLVTQLPYLIYRQVSQWGDKRANHLRYIAAAIAALAYGIWCLFSGPALWLSRRRVYYSDRLAAEITGNPNGLTRALLKIAQGVTKDIQQQGQTSWLLESFNLFTAISYQQAIALGSLHSCTELEDVLIGDILNPARQWLNLNNTHPLMGDRLQRLNYIARHWHLETELNLVKSHCVGRLCRLEAAGVQKSRDNSEFLLQMAPWLGIFLGLAFGGLTWLLGAIGGGLGVAQLAWMYGDRVILSGCLPVGFSIGTFIRINSFFPDIKPSRLQVNPDIKNLQANPTALPVNSQPIRLQGKLLGRRGISNWLGQDLILHSSTGLVKLHYVSVLGPVGNLWLRQPLHPTALVDRHLIATGWFRRGATAWIDVNALQTQGGKTSLSSHPLWSTVVASVAAAWGIYIIVYGGA